MLKEGLQAHLMQRVAADGMNLDPARLCYLVTKAGADAVGLGHEIGDLQPGKAADLVYVRPPDGTPLAEVLSRSQSLVESLAAIFTLAGPESIREVRVAGDVVHRSNT
jgi:guanine deaminase